MRAYVFTDKALTRHAGRFVWLEIDTEKAKNAWFSKRFGIRALPTFLILDPATETVTLRWVGGATVAQLDRMLEDARGAVAAGAGEGAGSAEGAAAARGGPPPGPRGEAAAGEALARADRLYGAGDYGPAAAAYGEALALAPADWPHYSRAVESRLFALTSSDSSEAAARLALDAYPRLARTPSAANVAASGLDASLALPADHRERAALVAAHLAAAQEVIADSTLAVAADDRSAVYGTLVGERQDANDEPGAREAALRWAAFLEREVARAKTPEQRAVFDSHLLSACIEAGDPARAIPRLEASERDFPDDYNPPARLAIAYQQIGRWDQALAASDRALAKAYGPRRLRLLRTRADIQAAGGDTTSARRTLEDAIATAEALPPGQRSESSIAGLKKRLEGLK
jgi:tetratricopeptide (TPR) repeat protein